jgi:hypothetical protein
MTLAPGGFSDDYLSCVGHSLDSGCGYWREKAEDGGYDRVETLARHVNALPSSVYGCLLGMPIVLGRVTRLLVSSLPPLRSKHAVPYLLVKTDRRR